jgi:ApaG protein
MYREITRDIQVVAEPQFLPQESTPETFVFGYKIRITNLGEEPAQLLSRHWIITDGRGTVREVKGEGVIGEQPRLEPGQSYEYTSFCPLPTPSGNMRGTYMMVGDDEESFTVKIPLFFLRDESRLH